MKKKSFFDKFRSNKKSKDQGEKPSESREFVAEQLEARILYSAAPVDVPVEQAPQEAVEEVSDGGFEAIEDFGGAAPEVSEMTEAPGGEMVTLTSLDNLSAEEIETLADCKKASVLNFSNSSTLFGILFV